MFIKLYDVISAITMSFLATVTPSVASADEITLTFEMTGMTIAGKYVGFRENAYIIMTADGPLHVPAVLVSCQGADCLDLTFPTRQASL